MVEIFTKNKSQGLKDAENAYIAFCRSLNLPDVASTDDFNNLYQQMKSNGKTQEAMEIAIQALSLINNVSQNGGKWAEITWNE